MNQPVEQFKEIPRFHTYSTGHAYLFISLVLSSCTSLRGASRTLELILRFLGINVSIPCFQTGRLWILRLGYYKLMREKEKAEDWIWIVDHTVQCGKEKCLAILGIRQSGLPNGDKILCFEDVEPIALFPVSKSNGEVVYEQLEDTVCKTGVPREIISDHGSDIKKGIERFCDAHPETCFIYDIKHKAAAILKRELSKDERWNEFTKLSAKTRNKVQQTELAGFAPPNQRTKARYMNVEELVKWGMDKIFLLKEEKGKENSEYERLTEKLGWLFDYEKYIANWEELIRIVEEAVDFVKIRGIYNGCEIELMKLAKFDAKTNQAKDVREELFEFMCEEGQRAKGNEVLLGSSEIIESVFGKYKQLEHEQSKSGFTVYLLSIAASLSKTTEEVVQNALETVRTNKVHKWFKENVGKSVHSIKAELNSIVKKAKQKWDEKCFES